MDDMNNPDPRNWTEKEYEEYIIKNEGLIHKLCHKYYGKIGYEDLANELRISMWQALKRFNPQKANNTKLSTYLYTIIKNRAYELNRDQIQKKRNPGYQILSIDAFQWDDESVDLLKFAQEDHSPFREDEFDPQSYVEQREQIEIVFSLLRSKSSRTQTAVTMYFNGRYQSEIAKKLNLTQSHISQILNRFFQDAKVVLERKGYH